MTADPPEFELQQELQRFTTQFSDRVTQATEILERSARPGVRDAALKKNLLYVSSAMEIATGPFAEINLLDMIVFVRLSRTVLENHFIPELYGDEGGDLSEVFSRSEHELSEVAARALSPAQREQLAGLRVLGSRRTPLNFGWRGSAWRISPVQRGARRPSAPRRQRDCSRASRPRRARRTRRCS